MPADNNSIVDQTHWDMGYEELSLKTIPDHDLFKIFLKSIIPQGNGSCIEIGAYPCRYLGIFVELGYKLSGIDTTPKIESAELKMWFAENGWEYEILEKTNLFNFKPDKQFDVVCSLGFIEHFEDWEDIILRHDALLKAGGYMVLQTPNFAGFVQRAIHVLTDKENYKRHIVRSMNPKKWADVLRRDYEIIYQGYWGGYSFWIENDKCNIFQKFLLKCFTVPVLLSRFLPNCRAYSPLCVLIARKNA